MMDAAALLMIVIGIHAARRTLDSDDRIVYVVLSWIAAALMAIVGRCQ